MTRVIFQPFDSTTLGKLLKEALNGQHGDFYSFEGAIAFVKRSGVLHIAQELKEFSKTKKINLIVGVNHHVTTIEGLAILLESVSPTGEIYVNHSTGSLRATFHPKVYLFEGKEEALLIVGSGNLTSGGLYTNDESFSISKLNLNKGEDQDLLNHIKERLNVWRNKNNDNVKPLDSDTLIQLKDQDLIRPEVFSRQEADIEDDAYEQESSKNDGANPVGRLFGSGPTRPYAPKIPRNLTDDQISIQDGPNIKQDLPPLTDGEEEEDIQRAFYVTALHGDLPQAGSSNEIRIGKGLRDMHPEFWGWPHEFSHDPITDQRTRHINIQFRDSIISAYLKDFPGKKPDGTKASADFRLGSIKPIVHSLNQEGDLIILEYSNDPGINFKARVINKSNEQEYAMVSDGLIAYTKSKSTTTGTFKMFRYSR